MTVTTSVGILGLGVFLPDEVRTNDWWAGEIVEAWKAALPIELPPAHNDDEALVYGLIERCGNDPFAGAVERRVMAEGMTVSDMEAAAVKVALDDAGLDPSEVDVLLVYSAMPEMQITNGACSVQQKVGIPRDSLTLSVNSGCNSFQSQVPIATAMIRAGQARYVVLVQSAALSKVLRYERPSSAWFGDGATAVVFGPVQEGRGILGQSHKSDGALQGTLVCTVPGGDWYDDGRPTLHTPDGMRAQVHTMMVRVPHLARTSCSEALEQAGLDRENVDFFASHQGFSWFREAAQIGAGLEHVPTLDTFAQTASMAAANIPMVLAVARDRGMLADDDVIVTHSGGSGITWASLVMRWGR